MQPTRPVRTAALLVGIAALLAVSCNPHANTRPPAPDPEIDRLAATGPAPEKTPAAAKKPEPDFPLGRWHKNHNLHRAADRASDDPETVKKLWALGYTRGADPVPSQAGVVAYDPARAQDGLNFYSSGHGPEAILMDMDGRVRHRWRLDLKGAQLAPKKVKYKNDAGCWQRAYPLPDGDVLAIFEGIGIVRLNKDSQLEWSLRGNVHHDIDVAADGTIYTLTTQYRGFRFDGVARRIVDDAVLVLSPDGRELDRISLWDAMLPSPFAPLLDPIRAGDTVFHTNTVDVLEEDRTALNPAFRRGNILVSARDLNMIGVIDPESRRMVWATRGPWRRQHNPSVVESGRVLMFDNYGPDGKSRAIEYDPRAETITWQYAGTADDRIFSATQGTARRLANGDTLITVSNAGRVLEVSPDGRIAWEFYNPAATGENDEYIATIYRMDRLPPDFGAAWLDRP